MTVVTRFAPSPTGLLHLGHAHAALFAWRLAQAAGRAAGGRFLLRIEDIDGGRCKPEFEAAIEEDMAWLGLDWERPVMRQSERMAHYGAALGRLREARLVYPCFCTRKEIRAEIARAGQAPHRAEGPLYPGICRRLTDDERAARTAAGVPHALRLDMTAATARAGSLTWHERGRGDIAVQPALLGDVVLARKDVPTSYHLAVTLDDADQGVTLVTRGDDLLPSTHVHRLLQALLDLPVPEWQHHGLITDQAGERIAKRNNPTTLRNLRQAGTSPAQVRALAGFPDE